MSIHSDSDKSASALLTVERGLQVLRAFRSERAPLSNAELVRRTGLSKATVSRLTTTLLQTGFLVHVPGAREFELATAPLRIGHSFLATSELLQTANPFMQELADRLNLSVALGMRDGLDLLYIGYKVSHKVATLRLGVGSVLPMATTAIGRAYLWGLPEAQQRRLIAQLRQAAGRQGAAMERGIREGFAELERMGTCAVLGGYQRGTYGVALPLRVGRDKVVMSLSCGKAEVQLDLSAERRRIDPALKKAALELQKLLADFDGQP